mgnify:FL=1
MLKLEVVVSDFFRLVLQQNIDIYNEFSLQHELGFFLRRVLPTYKVQFERNVSYFTSNTNTIKKEIDISIFSDDKSEKYALELKCPFNGQYPEQLYSFVKDIRFMEQMKERGFTNTYCIALVSDRPFYQGKINEGIYRYFRKELCVYGDIYKPTGPMKNIECVTLSGKYSFEWHKLDEIRRYFIIKI